MLVINQINVGRRAYLGCPVMMARAKSKVPKPLQPSNSQDESLKKWVLWTLARRENNIKFEKSFMEKMLKMHEPRRGLQNRLTKESWEGQVLRVQWGHHCLATECIRQHTWAKLWYREDHGGIYIYTYTAPKSLSGRERRNKVVGRTWTCLIMVSAHLGQRKMTA